MNFSGGPSPHCETSASSAGSRCEPFFTLRRSEVGPVLVHAAPGVGPVVVDLAAEQMPAEPPHVLVGSEGFEIVVAHGDVVDVGHLERQMVEPGLLVAQAEEDVVVDEIVAAVEPVERADQVRLVAGIDVVGADEAERLAVPGDGLLEISAC